MRIISGYKRNSQKRTERAKNETSQQLPLSLTCASGALWAHTFTDTWFFSLRWKSSLSNWLLSHIFLDIVGESQQTNDFFTISSKHGQKKTFILKLGLIRKAIEFLKWKKYHVYFITLCFWQMAAVGTWSFSRPAVERTMSMLLAGQNATDVVETAMSGVYNLQYYVNIWLCHLINSLNSC